MRITQCPKDISTTSSEVLEDLLTLVSQGSSAVTQPQMHRSRLPIEQKNVRTPSLPPRCTTLLLRNLKSLAFVQLLDHQMGQIQVFPSSVHLNFWAVRRNELGPRQPKSTVQPEQAAARAQFMGRSPKPRNTHAFSFGKFGCYIPSSQLFLPSKYTIF